MVRKKLDPRILTLLQSSVSSHKRSFLLLIGDHGKDQIPNLHHILSRMSIRPLPSVLWCYKKELGFSSHKMKRMRKLKRQKSKGLDGASTEGMDNFELFLSATDITWCYYRDTPRILGRTYSLLVLQDFEALTPNILARTIETVEGGGLVVLLLRSVQSLKQVYAMTMDVHSRYRTEGSGDVVPRFNERFILSLAKCGNCLVCDDELNVLPLSREVVRGLDKESVDLEEGGEVVVVEEVTGEGELKTLKEELRDVPNVGAIVELAKTLDQGKAVLTFLEACSEKKSGGVIALTAARGRGKSAAIGLCLAGAISFRYSTIMVTAPAPENLVAVFDFVVRGLTALKYREHLDFTVVYNGASGREETKCVVAVDVHRDHRQVIRYVRPTEPDKFASAELIAIDEAAAIPLPTVRTLVTKDRLIFMSSTVNGYEGTGRALSLKLLKELRDGSRREALREATQSASDAVVPFGEEGRSKKKRDYRIHEKKWQAASDAAHNSSTSSSSLREITLTTPIRYATDDPIETWLHHLLCLDSTSSLPSLRSHLPPPSDCELYEVNRDALFSYHELSERFLQNVMGLYTAAHYKNSPNDLQMLSDAPSHALFCLLNAKDEERRSAAAADDDDRSHRLPDILCVIQVALEGKISKKTVQAQLSRGHRSAGDLIPWTISQQFNDGNFAKLSGARIVRVAVHPQLQGMGYGSRAVEVLTKYYNGEMMAMEGEEEEEESDSDSDGETEQRPSKSTGGGLHKEQLAPSPTLPPLLQPLTTSPPPLDWIGTSYGITPPLFRFWKRNGFKLLYLRQTTNELTGEHTAIVLRALPRRTGFDDAWLPAFRTDVRRRIISLLGGAFRGWDVRLAVGILDEEEEEDNDDNEDDDVTNDDADAKTRTMMRTELLKRGSTTAKLTLAELEHHLTPYDLQRLELYGRNLCDHHLITDLLPPLARLYFLRRLPPTASLSSVQEALLCGVGLQRRTMDELSHALGLPPHQTLAMFNKAIRKLSVALHAIAAADIEKEESEKEGKRREMVTSVKDVTVMTLRQDESEGVSDVMKRMEQDVNDDDDADEMERRRVASLSKKIGKDADLMRYAVKGTEEQWKEAVGEDGVKGTVQIRTEVVKRKKRKGDGEEDEFGKLVKSAVKEDKQNGKKRKKKKKVKGGR